MEPQKVFVWRRLEESLRLFGKEYDGHWWLALLVPVLLVGLVYVCWMYVRDGRTVGWPWAAFLGVLRSTVYCVLAFMFLLPAYQQIDETTTRFKVVVVFDVSGSMANKDEPPTEAVPVDKILSRQDKIVQFLTNEQVGFLKKLQAHPVTLYRFGGKLDTEFKTLQTTEENKDQENEAWTRDRWLKFLCPDPRQPIPANLTDEEKNEFRNKLDLYALLVNGTNVGDSLLEVLKRETNNQPQGIVLFSDGRSTHFSTQTFAEVHKLKVPIFTVGVGEYRDPINIRITELLAPEQAQPDDKFRVTVEIDGEGKADDEVEVFLDIFKPGEEKTPSATLPEKTRFKRGDTPHAQAEFQIDAAALPADLLKPDSSASKPELLEGKWKFVARVPKDKREVFGPKEHVSEPEYVHVIKKPLRILLFAGAPTRDYQFARTMFVREVDAKRAELSIYLQLARADIVQDVPSERLLREFPSFISSTQDANVKPEDKYGNFLQYDVIIAFDPDWTKLQPEQIAALERWVSRHYGGLILVGGPVNTFQLARPGLNQEKLRPILDMFPVILEDNRLQMVDRSTTEPHRLNFPGATSEMEFLKLDDESKEPLSGWEEFFTGRKASEREAGRETALRRGFYDFYPVKEVKPSTTVVATFADSRSRMKDGKEQPYLATMPYQGGKVAWIGSGELWRLRQYREGFHERFWTKLCRFAGAGSQSGEKSRGTIAIGRTYTTNQIIRMKARLLGRDMKPLPPRTRPKVTLLPQGGGKPLSFDLHSETSPEEFDKLSPEERERSWEGWFAGQFQIDAPGSYEIEIPIPDTSDKVSRKFLVTESNPELDNPRPDFGSLRQLASLANLVYPRLSEETRAKIEPELERSNSPLTKETDKDVRLFFDMRSAGLIPECMTVKPLPQKNRGPVQDLWDAGFSWGENPPLKVSVALLVIVGLLSIEWLTRKLLKLA